MSTTPGTFYRGLPCTHPERCEFCGRRYHDMPNREVMLNGHMGHLELDPITGATVLIDEGQ